MNCDKTDFMYPMLADVYYPIITQGEYGKAIKEWIFDRTITCNAESLIQKSNEEILSFYHFLSLLLRYFGPV